MAVFGANMGPTAFAENNMTALGELRMVAQSATTKFHAATDIGGIQKIDGAYVALQGQRAQKMSISRDNMLSWMNKVEAAKWEAKRPADRAEAAHVERMALVDRERYSLSKLVGELELAIQREEAALSQLQERAAAVSVRVQQIADEATQLSPARARAIMFRSELGLSWAMDELTLPTELNENVSVDVLLDQPLKCHVVSRRLNDVFILALPAYSTADGRRRAAAADAMRAWDLIAPQ